MAKRKTKKLDSEYYLGVQRRSSHAEMRSTLILAYDMEDKGTPQSVFIFVADHKPDIDIRAAMKAAFTEWVETPEGAEWVKLNGCNWGDALEIPYQILHKHNIWGYSDPKRFENNINHIKVVFEDQLVVDHHEALVD